MSNRTIVRTLTFQGLTASNIARQLGISRERVRQIKVDEELPTRSRKLPSICPICGEPARYTFCSGGCAQTNKHRTHSRWVTCDDCGKPVVRTLSKLARNRHTFCDNKCKGHYVDTHWGGKKGEKVDGK